MADNYLEHRMDDYRSGRIAAANRPRRRRTPTASFILTGSPSPLLDAVIAAFRVAGTVVLCGDASPDFRDTAQRTGARLYPYGADAPARAHADCGTFDLAVALLTDPAPISPLARRTVAVVSDSAPHPGATCTIRHSDDIKATADLCRLMAYPEARHLSGIILP